MNARDLRLLGLLGGLAALVYFVTRPRSATSAAGALSLLSSGLDTVSATLSGWKNTQQGPKWVPVLNAAEVQYGIPTDLLARIAYEESHFRSDIIDGTDVSTAGAKGLMQLEPEYFTSVNVAVPYTDDDINNQIQQAAAALVADYNALGDWSLATAAYNAGLGAVKKYGGIPPFKETQDYVAQITADVPALSASA